MSSNAEHPSEQPVPAGEPDGQPSPAAPRKRLPWRMLVAAALAFGAALGASWYLHTRPVGRIHVHGQAPHESPQAVQPATAPDEVTTLPFDEAVQRGDALFRSADFVAARTIYEQLCSRRNDAAAECLRLRAAMCCEHLDQLAAAAAEYQQLLDEAQDERVVHAARYGLLRVAAAGEDWSTVESLLGAMSLDARVNCSRLDPNMIYLAALAAAAGQSADTDLLADDAPAYPRTSAASTLPDELLEIPTGSTVAPDRSFDLGVSIKPIARTTHMPDGFSLSASAHMASVVQIIEGCGESAGFAVHWSPAARDIARMQSVDVFFAQGDAALLFDWLLRPLGLAWRCEADGLHVLAHKDAADSQELKRARAARELRYAIATWPDHPAVAAAEICLANQALADGQLAEADEAYRHALERRPDAETRAAALFNLAKTQMRLGQDEEAREGFFRVVDATPRGPLAAAALVHIARMWIELDDAAQAVPSLERALALPHDTYLPAAALLMAATHHMLGDQAAARAVLSDYRETLTLSRYRHSAALLAALSKLASKSSGEESPASGRELIEALARFHPQEFPGWRGYELRADAFERLGLKAKTIESLQAAFDLGASGAMARRMALRLACLHLDAGDAGEGLRLLRELARQGQSKEALQAQVALAGIAFRRGDHDGCLAACEAILDRAQNDAIKAAALTLMGRVYQERGDHDSAALCFAGLAPPEQPEEEQ